MRTFKMMTLVKLMKDGWLEFVTDRFGTYVEIRWTQSGQRETVKIKE